MAPISRPRASDLRAAHPRSKRGGANIGVDAGTEHHITGGVKIHL